LKKVDVLIIGGGIIGTSAAFFLSKKKVDLILIEKSDIGREASGATAGTLSIQNKELSLIPLAREGVKTWASLQEELKESLEFHQTGGLRVAEDSQQLELLSQSIEKQKKAGLDVELISQKDLSDHAAYLSSAIVGASYCKEDSKCNPLKASLALAQAAQANGARINIHETVTGIQSINKDSFTVLTSKEQYLASCILNCAGVWSKYIFRMIELDMPICLSPQQMMVTEVVPRIIGHVITHIKGKITLKQVDRGNILIGGGWEGHGDLDKNIKLISYESLLGNAQIACRIVPALKKLNLIRCWIGSEGRTPDQLPLIGNLNHLPHFYTACCAKGGFTLGPFIAKIVAELIIKGKTDYPISAFNVNRFIPK
jgi:glycine/D-amino acid oxidase-like deaminating enzyme